MTFAPLAEIVRRAGGADRAGMLGLLGGDPQAEAIADRLRAALGLRRAPYPREEIFWAVRRLLTALAHPRPLLLVLDDLHWAEPTLLELLAHVAQRADAPPLLLALARPELADQQPDLARAARATLALPPLAESESEALLGDLAPALDAPGRARTLAAAEGNPLFLEQLVAFLAERPHGDDAALPPTLAALLAARLDRLGPAERALAQAAAVLGREFTTPTLDPLLPAPARPQAHRHLQTLTAKGLLDHQPGPTPTTDGFRFRHALIRDAAYRSLPKAQRADLHQHAAAALQHDPHQDELIGYHLEHAHGYLSELGLIDEHAHHLATQAAHHLATAARHRTATGDPAAAEKLLRRALTLLPDQAAQRPRLLLDLGTALRRQEQLQPADTALTQAAATARALGDQTVEWQATLARAEVLLPIDPAGRADAAKESAEQAITVFQELGDEARLSRAWILLATVRHMWAQGGEMERAALRALHHAQRANDEQAQAEAVELAAYAVEMGPAAVGEALKRLEGYLAWARRKGNRDLEGNLLIGLGHLRAMAGRFREARATMKSARATLEELGVPGWLPYLDREEGRIELLAGDTALAEAKLRAAYEALRMTGEQSRLSTLAVELADVVLLQGRDNEADDLTRVSEEAAAADDLASQVRWRSVRAKVRARQGRTIEAEKLAREGAALAEATDCLNWRAAAVMDLVEVLRSLGRHTEARDRVREAVLLYERKGNLAAANRARATLTELGARADLSGTAG
jgi:tetratricopeptide (TPR) repeat protein